MLEKITDAKAAIRALSSIWKCGPVPAIRRASHERLG